jgi:hypothetical protein
LARNFALLGGQVDTVSPQPGGVLLHVKEVDAPEPQASKHDALKPEEGTQP